MGAGGEAEEATVFGAGRLAEAKRCLGAAKGAGSGGWDRGGLAGPASVLRGAGTSEEQRLFGSYIITCI